MILVRQPSFKNHQPLKNNTRPELSRRLHGSYGSRRDVEWREGRPDGRAFALVLRASSCAIGSSAFDFLKYSAIAPHPPKIDGANGRPRLRIIRLNGI